MNFLPSINQLNKETPEEFIKVVNILFEAAPPLTKRLLAIRPFTSYTELINSTEKICLSNELDLEERLEVINAHPRIGASKANLSACSLREQGYTDTLQTKEDKTINIELAKLNQQYEKQYGFKFIIFVNGRSRQQIIPIIKERIKDSNRERELYTAIIDMMLIAKDRLKKSNRN
ncbi:Oxo-4-hydroxy-4-carboxy-5-ureidoimidazoline decarboxylase [Cokeromyces recurvatus]|uniref:Oxo-4-hydroxy-4-carboxy-5-ureidoimidazoline decarboxylase n=1 Tax=Cokeromyces recurvatus TaxID=90255 RepID=UPI00221E7548|nr:Oxo-4-hydroxy-4-carboxy-5-ureidoimidazoline decarboxylase [Cokeromyces recurvatus]KAI7902625.1 Oxo-4-hydroxy-4-carboxy-5-ureidoimidazoline decarboxylase [Cokeromyces recurvatus]